MTTAERRSGAAARAVEFDARKIDAIIAHLDQGQFPGLAVGIAVRGTPVYRKGVGLANMELPVVLSPSIRMRIYSITKHFTCFGFLRLCEEGKASPDDPLGKFFPEFHAVTQRVTMRQLMSNTGGLRDAHGLHFQFSGTSWVAPSSEVIELYRTMDDVDVQPNTTWIYNNGGFVLLTHAIERISGLSFEEYMRQRVFEPIGMLDTMIRRRDTNFVPNSASMHMTDGQGGFVKAYVGGDRAGTGGIVTTVNDLLRWLTHMDAPKIGSAETWSAMRTSHTLANGTSTGYGFGLVVDNYRGVKAIYHPGEGMGANAQVFKLPDVGLDIAIMTNREDVSSREIALKIIDACVTGLEPVRPASRFPLVEGTFLSSRTGRVIRLFSENEQQVAGISGWHDMRFEPDEKGVLWPAKTAVLPCQFAITPVGDREKPSALRFSDYGNADELERVAPAADQTLSSVVGRYRSDATGFEVSVSQNGMQTIGRFGSVQYRLDPLAPNVWRAKATSSLAPFLTGIVTFNAEGFSFWGYCVRDLPFKRVA